MNTRYTHIIMALALTTTVANANINPTPLEPITKTLKLGEDTIQLIINPAVALTGTDGSTQVDLNAIVDASELQKSLQNKLNKTHKNDECGTRLSTKHAVLRPASDGSLVVSLKATVEQWKCVSAHVPKTYSRTHKVLGAKIKLPYLKWVHERAKTKLVSQSAQFVLVVRPVADKDKVTVNVSVTKATLSGLLGSVVKALNLESMIKRQIEAELRKELKDKAISFPKSLKLFNVKISQLQFKDIGNGRLGLALTASASLTQQQLVAILNDELKK